MRVLALVSDAYGGRGGIALYNRNFLKALCEHPEIVEVRAIPRTITYGLEELPDKLIYVTSAAGSKLRYLFACVRIAFSSQRPDIIFCCHLHLLPFAYLLKIAFKCPVIPILYGVEAWTPTSRRTVNYLCRKVSGFISIRKLTARRFIDWAKLSHAKFYYLPNCIDELQYGIAPKRPDLLERYGIHGKVVIMTAGRLDRAEIDKNKGFDEVLGVLPELRKQVPNLAYIIMGDGDDRERMKKKAEALGVGDMVVFTGYVRDAEKADHYRLADAFAMPGSNKIFDRYPYRFVFLEALACGVPVVGCRLEDESEANDPDARKLIIQVDPNSKEEITQGILNALSLPKQIHPELSNFYYASFLKTLHRIVDELVRPTR